MKVVFLQDVPNVGRAGQIKEVADGYGRNFLIPRKLALLARPEAIHGMEVRLAVKTRHEAQTEAELRELADQLNGREFTIVARTGGKDKLYGSITAADIADEIERATGLVVDKRKIELEGTIRQVGRYEVPIRFAKDIEPQITVVVAEQNAEKEGLGESNEGEN